MEKILHQFLWQKFTYYLQGFIRPRWWFGISSINSIPPDGKRKNYRLKSVGESGESVSWGYLPGHIKNSTKKPVAPQMFCSILMTLSHLARRGWWLQAPRVTLFTCVGPRPWIGPRIQISSKSGIMPPRRSKWPHDADKYGLKHSASSTAEVRDWIQKVCYLVNGWANVNHVSHFVRTVVRNGQSSLKAAAAGSPTAPHMQRHVAVANGPCPCAPKCHPSSEVSRISGTFTQNHIYNKEKMVQRSSAEEIVSLL